MGIQECNHKGSYLRLPLCKFNSKRDDYRVVSEKLANKIAEWKYKTLKWFGKTILTKSIAQVIPRSIMTSFLMPKFILSKTDALKRLLMGLQRFSKVPSLSEVVVLNFLTKSSKRCLTLTNLL